MTADGAIARYLGALRAELSLSTARRRKRILADVEEHLHQAAAEIRSTGLDRSEAEAVATARFGSPSEVASAFAHGHWTVRHRRWAITLPLIILSQVMVIEAVYAFQVLRRSVPALPDLEPTTGVIEETHEACFSESRYPSHVSVCHYKVVLAQDAGWFWFPRRPLSSVEQVPNASKDRLRAGTQLVVWHQTGRPSRPSGSLGDVWQVRGEGWITRYDQLVQSDTAYEMEGVICGAVLALAAYYCCIGESSLRRTGGPSRAFATWETGFAAALPICVIVAATMQDTLLLGFVLALGTTILMIFLYPGQGQHGKQTTRATT